MPIYCYKCFDCNHYEEIKQSMDDDSLNVCPICGKPEFKRIIKNVGIIFKGSGFHITDYAKKNVLPNGPTRSAEKKEDTPESPKTEKPEKTEQPVSTPSAEAKKPDS